MSIELVKISIGGRTVRVPLENFLHIVGGSEVRDCKSAFMKARLAATATRGARGFHADRYWLGIGSQHSRYDSLAEVLVAAMGWIHRNDSAAHGDIAGRRKTTRAYIAQRPSDIYDAAFQHLSVFGRAYAPGWYLDTNLSHRGASRFLDDVFSCTSLARGRDWYFGRLY